MMADFRALCAELLDWAEVTAAHYIQLPAVMLRARAALADEPAVPTVMEIVELADEIEAAGLGQADLVRAALTRWGNPAPQPPADGEVAELVEMLKGIAYWKRHGKPGEPAPTSFDIRQADRLDRAAELLQRLSPPQPVPVSERLPGPEETTEDGEVWIEDPGHDYPLADTGDYDWEPHRWVLRQIGKFDAKNNLHWLPAHALPLPEVGE